MLYSWDLSAIDDVFRTGHTVCLRPRGEWCQVTPAGQHAAAKRCSRCTSYAAITRLSFRFPGCSRRVEPRTDHARTTPPVPAHPTVRLHAFGNAGVPRAGVAPRIARR